MKFCIFVGIGCAITRRHITFVALSSKALSIKKRFNHLIVYRRQFKCWIYIENKSKSIRTNRLFYFVCSFSFWFVPHYLWKSNIIYRQNISERKKKKIIANTTVENTYEFIIFIEWEKKHTHTKQTNNTQISC